MNLHDMEKQGVQFGYLGKGVMIHETVQIFNPSSIFIEDNSRIDCFAVLSAGSDGIHIGKHVHIAAAAMIFGGGGRVVLENYCGLSSRVTIYTATDDYTDGFMTNPTVPAEFKKVEVGNVVVQRHAIVGAGSVILPNVTLGVGAAVGALSLVRKSVDDFSVVLGAPARSIGKRSERLLDVQQKFESQGIKPQ